MMLQRGILEPVPLSPGMCMEERGALESGHMSEQTPGPGFRPDSLSLTYAIQGPRDLGLQALEYHDNLYQFISSMHCKQSPAHSKVVSFTIPQAYRPIQV